MATFAQVKRFEELCHRAQRPVPEALARRSQYKVADELFRLERELDETDLLRADLVESIADMSRRLLCHVVAVDTLDGRTVGLPYRQILALVLQKYPSARTKLKGLHWSAVHLRAEGVRMAQKRPHGMKRL